MKLTVIVLIFAAFVFCEVSKPTEGTKIIAKIKETWQNVKRRYFHRHNATVPCNSAEEVTTEPELLAEEQIDPRFSLNLADDKSVKKRQSLWENHYRIEHP